MYEIKDSAECSSDHDIQPMVRRLEEILRGPVGIIHPAGNSGPTTSTDTEMGNLDNVLIRKSKHILCTSFYMHTGMSFIHGSVNIHASALKIGHLCESFFF